MCTNLSAVEPLEGTAKNKYIIPRMFSIAVLGVLFTVYVSAVTFTYKIFLTILCPAAISKVAVILTFNAFMAAYIGGIYSFFKLECILCDYSYDFKLLDDESDIELIIPWYGIVMDLFTVLTIAVSGFWTGKIIVSLFMGIVKIFAL